MEYLCSAAYPTEHGATNSLHIQLGCIDLGCRLQIIQPRLRVFFPGLAAGISGILCQFLQHLRASGLYPTFFNTDKDTSEICQTRPNTVIQLCYWHARRAIRPRQRRLIQNEYRPSEAQTSLCTLGRMEPKDIQEKNTVVNIFSNHFNSHPFIPDQNGTCRSAQQIHRDCARETYSWYRSRNYFHLWAYL